MHSYHSLSGESARRLWRVRTSWPPSSAVVAVVPVVEVAPLHPRLDMASDGRDGFWPPTNNADNDEESSSSSPLLLTTQPLYDAADGILFGDAFGNDDVVAAGSENRVFFCRC